MDDIIHQMESSLEKDDYNAISSALDTLEPKLAEQSLKPTALKRLFELRAKVADKLGIIRTSSQPDQFDQPFTMFSEVAGKVVKDIRLFMITAEFPNPSELDQAA